MRDSRVAIDAGGRDRDCLRILVVSEQGRSGAAALARAAEYAAAVPAQVTVVAVTPQAASSCRSCGGVSPTAYNRAVREDVAQDLHAATTRLGFALENVSVKLLIEGTDPPLASWIAQGGFDVVVLPARGFGARLRGHPTARLLRGLDGIDVHVVVAPRRSMLARLT